MTLQPKTIMWTWRVVALLSAILFAIARIDYLPAYLTGLCVGFLGAAIKAVLDGWGSGR